MSRAVTPPGEASGRDLQRVTAFARRRFGPRAEVAPLAGDASERRFYRLRAPSLSSLILMVHPEPFELERLPYFVLCRFLHDIGAAVPQIIASYPSEGILVLQDLGDETLQAHLARCDAPRRRFLYLQAVQLIALLQSEGAGALGPGGPAATVALDGERLLGELRSFSEHYVQGLLGSPLAGQQAARLDAWFVCLARQVGGYRRVLCHRDFHARNLMVRGDRLFMVDFQDARPGPYTYDLASLVRDSYVVVPEELAAEMIEFYREATRATEPPDVFMTALRRTCLQRNIKAIGTFAFQAVRRGNRAYLPCIGPTLDSVRAGLAFEGEQGAAVLELFRGPLDYR